MTIQQHRSALDHLFNVLLFEASESLAAALYPSYPRNVWEPVHIVICANGKPLEPIGGVFDKRDTNLPGLLESIAAEVDLKGLTLDLMETEL